MSSITIRKLDPSVKERLRIRAAGHGRSMEAEARDILKDALWGADAEGAKERTGADLAAAIRARFAPFGEVEL
ncbi:MAG TPA: Arc family DNA-binding protein, partial [Stellaceae bacterium]|nr:Arc family DNA-binding protein [Stellaceae bacterium]